MPNNNPISKLNNQNLIYITNKNINPKPNLILEKK